MNDNIDPEPAVHASLAAMRKRTVVQAGCYAANRSIITFAVVEICEAGDQIGIANCSMRPSKPSSRLVDGSVTSIGLRLGKQENTRAQAHKGSTDLQGDWKSTSRADPAWSHKDRADDCLQVHCLILSE